MFGQTCLLLVFLRISNNGHPFPANLQKPNYSFYTIVLSIHIVSRILHQQMLFPPCLIHPSNSLLTNLPSTPLLRSRYFCLSNLVILFLNKKKTQLEPRIFWNYHFLRYVQTIKLDHIEFESIFIFQLFTLISDDFSHSPYITEN